MRDRLYEDAETLVNYDYDVTLVGAHLLGSDVAKISSDETKRYLTRLHSNQMENLTIVDLVQESVERYSDRLVRNEVILAAFFQGFIGER